MSVAQFANTVIDHCLFSSDFGSHSLTFFVLLFVGRNRVFTSGNVGFVLIVVPVNESSNDFPGTGEGAADHTSSFRYSLRNVVVGRRYEGKIFASWWW